MAVNLSVCQLYQSNFVENVEHVFRETGMVPSYLGLEITEDTTMDIYRILLSIRCLKHLLV